MDQDLIKEFAAQADYCARAMYTELQNKELDQKEFDPNSPEEIRKDIRLCLEKAQELEDRAEEYRWTAEQFKKSFAKVEGEKEV